jgi:hypothetical protein
MIFPLGDVQSRQSSLGFPETCSERKPVDLGHRRAGVEVQRHWARKSARIQVRIRRR